LEGSDKAPQKQEGNEGRKVRHASDETKETLNKQEHRNDDILSGQRLPCAKGGAPHIFVTQTRLVCTCGRGVW
jgi:hypothetical protein